METITFRSVDAGDMSVGMNPVRFKVTFESNVEIPVEEYKQFLSDIFDVQKKDVLEESEYQAELESEERYLVGSNVERVVDELLESDDAIYSSREAVDKIMDIVYQVKGSNRNA